MIRAALSASPLLNAGSVNAPREQASRQYRFDLQGCLFLHVRQHVRINV